MASPSPQLVPYDAPLPPSVPSAIPFQPPHARDLNSPAQSFSSASATTSSKSPCLPAVRRDTPVRAHAKPYSAPAAPIPPRRKAAPHLPNARRVPSTVASARDDVPPPAPRAQ